MKKNTEKERYIQELIPVIQEIYSLIKEKEQEGKLPPKKEIDYIEGTGTENYKKYAVEITYKIEWPAFRVVDMQEDDDWGWDKVLITDPYTPLEEPEDIIEEIIPLSEAERVAQEIMRCRKGKEKIRYYHALKKLKEIKEKIQNF